MINYKARVEAKPIGSQEDVAGVGEVVEAMKAMEKHIDSWPYIRPGDDKLEEVTAGCRESE